MTDTSTAIEVVSHEMVAGHPHFAMTTTEAQGWAVAVRDMKRSVLMDGSDYMVIPGTNKPSLLKPGAEMLLLAAGLGFSNIKVIDPSDVERGGVTYKCSVHRGSKDNVVAECDGYAGYDEDRFYKSAAENEATERYWANKKNRAPNELKFVEYKAPWNSVIKMAQKRALVGAALNACAASGLFTQDLEDERNLPPLWDATVVVQPYVDALSDEQRVELRAWWKLPSLARLTAEQGAVVLVKVGQLTAEPQTPSSSMAPDNPDYEADAARGPSCAPRPPVVPEPPQSAPERRPVPQPPVQAPPAAEPAPSPQTEQEIMDTVTGMDRATLVAELQERQPRKRIDGRDTDGALRSRLAEAFRQEAAAARTNALTAELSGQLAP